MQDGCGKEFIHLSLPFTASVMADLLIISARLL